MSSVKRTASEVYGELMHDSDCAVHNAPALPVGPCNCSAQAAATTRIVPVAQLSVLDVLEMCEREFAFLGGGTMTDMPDVPLSPETSWTMDFSQVLAAIAVAKEKLGGFVDCCTAGECAGCSNPQPMEPASATPKFEPEHLDTGKASKDST